MPLSLGSVADLLGLAALLAVAGAFGLAAWGRARWARRCQQLLGQLEAGRTDPPGLLQGAPTGAGQALALELQGLPAPVQRYFRAVLREGQPLVATATIDLRGSFNLSATRARWRPFNSTQMVGTRRPGFVWDARVALWPGVPVRVIDGYVAGQGHLRAAVLGLFTMARAEGGGELARGELMRWLAEAAWYPTALLPSQGVRWAAVDEHSADATLTDGANSVTLRFAFDATGLIESVQAAARGAGVGQAMVMLGWDCRLSNYRLHHGMWLPMAGEAAWLRPQGRQTYFRGTVSNIAIEFSP